MDYWRVNTPSPPKKKKHKMRQNDHKGSPDGCKMAKEVKNNLKRTNSNHIKTKKGKQNDHRGMKNGYQVVIVGCKISRLVWIYHKGIQNDSITTGWVASPSQVFKLAKESQKNYTVVNVGSIQLVCELFESLFQLPFLLFNNNFKKQNKSNKRWSSSSDMVVLVLSVLLQAESEQAVPSTRKTSRFLTAKLVYCD